MKEIVLQTIQEITAEKIEAKRFPIFALRVEISKRISKKTDEALKELVQNQTVKTDNTINDTYFEVQNPQPDKAIKA